LPPWLALTMVVPGAVYVADVPVSGDLTDEP